MEEIDLEVQFSEIQKPCDLDLDLGSGRGHTGAHNWSRSTHIPNLIQIRKNFFVDGSAYGRTDTPDFSKSIRTSPGDDLKLEAVQTKFTKRLKGCSYLHLPREEAPHGRSYFNL